MGRLWSRIPKLYKKDLEGLKTDVIPKVTDTYSVGSSLLKFLAGFFVTITAALVIVSQISGGGSAIQLNDSLNAMGYDGTNFSLIQSVTGNFTGNLTGDFYYGEMWNYSANATAWLFPIATQGVYYNLTNLTAGDLNGFTFTDGGDLTGGSHLTAQVAGRYSVALSISIEGQT